jgi:hypothetical protein
VLLRAGRHRADSIIRTCRRGKMGEHCQGTTLGGPPLPRREQAVRQPENKRIDYARPYLVPLRHIQCTLLRRDRTARWGTATLLTDSAIVLKVDRAYTLSVLYPRMSHSV